MSKHRSLVAFTLLTQSSVGGIWCVGIALLLGDDPLHYGRHAFVGLLLVLVGLSFSTGHLGRPSICFYAIRNLKRSWVSREVAAMVTLAAAMAAIAFTSLWPVGLNGWTVLAASVMGGFSLYAMARAYQLRTVPSWNHGGTLLSFLGSALLLGGFQFTVVSDASTALTGPVYGFAGLHLSGYVGLFVAYAGFLLKLLSHGPNHPEAKESGMHSGFSQPILQGIGFAIWLASAMSERGAGLEWGLLSLAAGLLIFGEIIHRNRFYDLYRSACLPH